MSERNPEPVEQRIENLAEREGVEQRSIDPQLVVDGVTAIGVLATGAAAVKQALGGNDSEPPPPPPPEQPPPPPADAQAAKPSD